MFKTFSVNELAPGMMVSKVLEQHGPVKIRKVGMIRSQDMIKGLSEMGVTQVEVDLSQSLGLEDDAQSEVPEAISTIDGTHTTKVADETATQRLVASNKRVADVDRQLSQQFHRSLFLPAVEQMPSKWSLYGKPYAILAGCVVVGFCIGLILSATALHGTSWLFGSNEAPIVSNESIAEREAKQELNIEPAQGGASESPQGLSTQTDGLAQPAPELVQAPAQAVVDDIVQQDVVQQDVVQQGAAQQEAPQQQAIQQEAGQNEPPALVSINGVIVEEGQQVLGYQNTNAQATAPQEPIANNVSSSNVNNKPIQGNPSASSNISSEDLLRRIQEAANDIDKQSSSEPEPYEAERASEARTYNDVLRIDQLSPAVLTQMPGMSFSAHMYASNPIDRWVRVNGKRLGEGDYISDDLQLLRIEPDRVILSFKGDDFRMNALSDW